MASPTPSGRDTNRTIASRGQARVATQSQALRAPALPAQAPLDRVQSTLPGRLRAVPLQAVLAAGGLVVTSSLVVLLALVRSSDAIAALEDDAPRPAAAASATARASTGASSTAAKAPSAPTGAELDAARLKGADALATLAQRFPEDADVLQALCVAQAHETKDHASALRTLRHLLEVAPQKKADKDVQQALLDIANGPPDTAAAALEIMKTQMGTYGPDLVFDLVQLGGGKYAKEHAAAALADPELMKSASKALIIAEELRKRLPCARKSLIARASAEGDRRSLPHLRQLVATTCKSGIRGLFGGSDCYACFTPQDRMAIGAAIETISRRDGGAGPGPAPTAAPTSTGGSTLK